MIRKDEFAPGLWTVLASEAEPELSGATCAELNIRSINERMSLGIHTVQISSGQFRSRFSIRLFMSDFVKSHEFGVDAGTPLRSWDMPVASSGHMKRKLKPHTTRLFWLTRRSWLKSHDH